MNKQPSVTKTAYDTLLAKLSALSVGYEPAKKSGTIYRELLERVASHGITRPRRQTPLINAGYAVRVSSVTSPIQSFVEFHSSAAESIQIVMIGCGLDITGLWAYSLDPSAVRLVVELDTEDTCLAKRDILCSEKLVTPLQSLNTQEEVVLSGDILLGSDETVDSSSEANYVLARCDLKDTSQLGSILSMLNPSLPTLVVSELVLAYLGQEGTDRILQFCSEDVCKAPGSALIVYEPVGSTTSTRTVVAGYQKRYASQFKEKLQRGTNNDDNDLFHPLAASSSEVEIQFESAGFSWAYACLAGHAAASCSAHTLSCLEPFDEHAALALHLSSYVVGCAFSRGTEIDLMMRICPWSSLSIFREPPPGLKEGVSLSPIQSQDQKQVNFLFVRTYQDLAVAHKPVKKMLHAALKSDLNFSLDEIVSSIGSRYKHLGGLFVVATTVENEPSRRVVGCAGIRPCILSDDSSAHQSYEINRLAVDVSYRGQGIGKALVEILIQFIHHQLGDSSPYRIVATTPSLMTAANNLYLSCHFTLTKEEDIRGLVLNTFVRHS